MTVLDCQAEISFAFVDGAEDLAHPIVLGSHLEAIPVGSIGHLLPSASRYFPERGKSEEVSGLASLEAYVSASSNSGSPFAIVVRLTHEGDYLRKFGSVALNLALSQLYREAQLHFHAAHAVEVLDRASVCIVGPRTGFKEAMVATFVEAMAAQMPELGVYAGVFCDADKKSKTPNGDLQLDSTHAIDFARFAASDSGRPPDSRVRHFSHAVAVEVLQALREARAYETVYADVERLRTLGLDTASIINIGGLAAGSLGRFRVAADHYAAAVAKDPLSVVFRGNYGVAAYPAGEVDQALKILNGLTEPELEKLLSLHAYGYLGSPRSSTPNALSA